MSDQRETIVELFGAAMRYGAGPVVLRDIDLILQAGSCHVLLGASGAGKSSLLRTIALAPRPCSGQIRLFGQDVGKLPSAELPSVRRRLGLVFQDLRLLDHLTTFDNVALPLRLREIDEAEIEARGAELLHWLDLDRVRGRPAGDLPQAERQLVAVARAVIARPDLLLADQPTAHLDQARTERVLHLFQELNRSGMALLLATGDPDLLTGHRTASITIADGTARSAAANLPLLAGLDA